MCTLKWLNKIESGDGNQKHEAEMKIQTEKLLVEI